MTKSWENGKTEDTTEEKNYGLWLLKTWKTTEIVWIWKLLAWCPLKTSETLTEVILLGVLWGTVCNVYTTGIFLKSRKILLLYCIKM